MHKITKEEFDAIVKKHLSTIEGIDQLLAYLESKNFYIDPASYKYHSCYAGGLITHSVLVASNLVKLTKKFNIAWTRPESPYLIGLFHDVCKAGTYTVKLRNVKDEATQQWRKEPFYEPTDTEPLGHGSKSVIILQKFIGLTDQELYCIYHHMGAFAEKEIQYAYSAAAKVYPEIMLVALADELAGVMETRDDEGKTSLSFSLT